MVLQCGGDWKTEDTVGNESRDCGTASHIEVPVGASAALLPIQVPANTPQIAGGPLGP